MNYYDMFEEDMHERFRELETHAKEEYDVIEGTWYVFDDNAILVDNTASIIKSITIEEWNKNKDKYLEIED